MDKYVDFIAKMITEDPDVLREASKKSKSKSKRPKVDKDGFENKFKVDDALEDKDEPSDPSKKDRNQTSKLNDNDGAKQTGSAYLNK